MLENGLAKGRNNYLIMGGVGYKYPWQEKPVYWKYIKSEASGALITLKLS